MEDDSESTGTLPPHWQNHSREFLEAVVENFAPGKVPAGELGPTGPVHFHMYNAAVYYHPAIKQYLALGKPAGKMDDDERKMLQGMLVALQLSRDVESVNYALMNDVSFR